MPFSFVFRPRLLDALQGYDRERFWRDLGAGVTVGIVALPLAMAFAIASGLKPEAGLWTAIIAGLLISLFGGSHIQIGGPAGAFIVIVYGIVERYGLANMLIATGCAGVLLFAARPAAAGTAGALCTDQHRDRVHQRHCRADRRSQIKDWLGLQVPKMPADFFAQLKVLGANIGSFNLYAFSLGSRVHPRRCCCGPGSGANVRLSRPPSTCRACAAP